jgi:hypothetical protein
MKEGKEKRRRCKSKKEERVKMRGIDVKGIKMRKGK